MRIHNSRFMLVLVLAGLGSSSGALAQTNNNSLRKTPQGKPDFSGFYDIPYVPNMSAGPRIGGTLRLGELDAAASGEAAVPYTQAGKAAYINHDAKDDPTANCWLPGVPRIMQSPYPAQIVQNDDHLVILFEYMHTFRSIPLNGRPHPPNMEPAFLGDSTGHWEGDEIVVDTVGLKGAPWIWLDTAGHQQSSESHVIERFRRNGDNVEYQYTLEDPKTYAKPWTLKRTLTPLKMAAGLPELLEYECSENNRDLKHLVPTKPALEQK